jgi:mono/diheme cytochrome c family protein
MKKNRTVPGLMLVFLAIGFIATTAYAQPVSASTNAAPENPAAAGVPKDNPTYLRDVLPIFMGACFRCHNDQNKLLYNCTSYKGAVADRSEVKLRIWDSWKGRYYKQPMPVEDSPESQQLTGEQRLVVKRWVETGMAYGVAPVETGPRTKAERIELGRKLFATVCASCHQPNGLGIPARFPPLAASDFLNADKDRAVKTVINGLQGEVVVNGLKFTSSMPRFPLGDADIANVLTYVYNSFGNSGNEVTPDEVKVLRAQKEEAVAPHETKPVAPGKFE